MGDFLNLNLHFPNVRSLAAWLATLPRPTWGAIGSTLHNTYIPNRLQWRGHDSMRSMAVTYARKGWSTGPHLYLASGTAYDGIFVMCPPTQPGIHGVTCNRDRFGIENVDDWNLHQPTEAQKRLFVEVAATLHSWAGIGADVNGHCDCVPRTCPGQFGYAALPELRTRLAMMLNTTRLEPDPRPGALAPYADESPLLAVPSGNEETFTAAWLDKASRAKYDDVSIVTIARAYWKIATAAGLDPWLAAGQCMHETGWLTS
ncbi:MAG TPA: hypothetical protein VFT99_18610, partial [Roseiflexaceae bacterium]|nr:hypothetical protein [Roseiflexaceae bacterium]